MINNVGTCIASANKEKLRNYAIELKILLTLTICQQNNRRHEWEWTFPTYVISIKLFFSHCLIKTVYGLYISHIWGTDIVNSTNWRSTRELDLYHSKCCFLDKRTVSNFRKYFIIGPSSRNFTSQLNVSKNFRTIFKILA